MSKKIKIFTIIIENEGNVNFNFEQFNISKAFDNRHLIIFTIRSTHITHRIKE